MNRSTAALSGFVGGVLLLMATPVAGAESAPQPEIAATHVTGRVVAQEWDHSQREVTVTDDSALSRGVVLVETLEWTDPRLPSMKTTVANTDNYPVGNQRSDEPGRVVAYVASSRLDDATGSWVGTATGMQFAYGKGTTVEVLVGSGAYEGLYAVLACEPAGCDGYILPGEPPPVPDPPPA